MTEITDFGFFTVIEPPPGNHVLLFVNDMGLDWYDMRFALTRWDSRGEYLDAVYGAWAMVDRQGTVTHVESDPSRLMPGDRTVLGIDADPADVKPGMIWDGEQLLQPTEESLAKIGPPL